MCRTGHKTSGAWCIVLAAAISEAEVYDLEDHNMQSAQRIIGSIFLTAALMAPATVIAAPRPQTASVQVRVYDKDHKDYHNWDDNENQAWGRFQVENKSKPHEYAKANKKEQSQYWNWRHANPDKN